MAGENRIEVGLVLQGGGALGAYEWGAVTALLELMDEAEAAGREVVLKGVTACRSALSTPPASSARTAAPTPAGA
jgi:hypothetical protein